jgi:hypothetical protein
MDPMTIAAIISLASAGIGAATGARDKKRSGVQQSPTVTPEVQRMIEQLGKMGLQGAQDMYPRMMGDPNAAFEPYAQQATSRFESQGIPSLTERFTSMGQGAQRSSAFPQLLGSARGDFERDLNAQRMQFGENRMGMQQNFLSSLLSGGMQPTFQSYYRQQAPNPWFGLAGQIGSTIPDYMKNQQTPRG